MSGHGTCTMGEPSPCLLPQVLFSSHRWEREVEFCSSLVRRRIRGQSRFCLAHRPNITALKPDLIWFVFPPMCSYVEFRGFLIHSLFWALLIVEFSKKHDHQPPAPCRAAGRAGKAGHIAGGCSAFPPWPPQRQLSAQNLPSFSAPRLILETHPWCCGLGLFFLCIRVFL